MSTPNRAESNRAEVNKKNAQHSSLNAMKHDYTGQLVVIPDEDLQLYESLKKSFRDEYQPQGATEENLVQALADVSWRLNRVALLESNLLSISYTPRDLVDCLFAQAKALASLSMHSQRLSRQFERTVALLRQLQQARRTQEKKALDLHESTGKTSGHGFVFSERQIDAGILPRDRERLVEEACDHRCESEAA
jgi:hypothetical protein